MRNNALRFAISCTTAIILLTSLAFAETADEELQRVREKVSDMFQEIEPQHVNPGPIDTDLAKEFPADKASPQETAERIIQGIENDQADIFPDDGGRQMFDVWNNDYRDLEAMVNQMHHAA